MAVAPSAASYQLSPCTGRARRVRFPCVTTKDTLTTRLFLPAVANRDGGEKEYYGRIES